MKYKTVVSQLPHVLHGGVNDLLAQGWKLQGSLALAYDDNNEVLYGQALVFEDESARYPDDDLLG